MCLPTGRSESYSIGIYVHMYGACLPGEAAINSAGGYKVKSAPGGEGEDKGKRVWSESAGSGYISIKEG